LFSWHTFKELPVDEASKLQYEIQALSGNLSSVAREVAFIPTMNIIFKKNPLRVVQNQLKSGKEIGRIGDTREVC
jgi:hypothetical protein